MKSILAFFNFVETYKVTGAAILGLIVAGIIGIFRIIIGAISKKKQYPYTKTKYFGLKRNIYITSVNEYVPDSNPSGYIQRSYPREDQWSKKVLYLSFFKLLHIIVPLNNSDILAISVRKNRKEKIILINRKI